MAIAQAGLPDGPDAATTDVPVLVGISLDFSTRERIAGIVDGAGVLVFAPDVESARAILGRQIGMEQAATRDPALAGDEPDVLRVGDLEVDSPHGRVRWRGTTLPLSRRERALLRALTSGSLRVWSYPELYEAAWPDHYLDPGPVHAAVKRLRRKLRDAGVDLEIEAARGVGYALVPADG